jgi:hypothetical protein
MPYIEPKDYYRSSYQPKTPGELNFAITLLLIVYMDEKGLSYSSINDCMGALEGAKAEFYRRVAVPYEEVKRAINGDVYPTRLTTSTKDKISE